MEMVPVQYNGFKMENKEFTPQTCEEREVEEYHEKHKPVCKNVTKQNCVTKWVVKPSGQKVCNLDMKLPKTFQTLLGQTHEILEAE